MEDFKKVFISYSWSSSDHEEWVVQLAERLVDDGIDVVLDKWELKEGDDKYVFMESMVNSKEIDKVLIILDQSYSDKANDRKGGVGTETLIISPKVYGQVKQQKFIPIVRGLDENSRAYIPTYLQGRIYIDLSERINFEVEYEKLLRAILQRPSYRKPKLGTPPSYLFESSPFTSKTSLILRMLENPVNQSTQRVETIFKDFINAYFSDLDELEIKLTRINNIEFGKAICEAVRQHQLLRDNVVAFFDKLLKINLIINEDLIIEYLENLHSYHRKIDSSYVCDNDHYKMIIHELFLYLIALALKHKKYKVLEALLNDSFYVYSQKEYATSNSTFVEFHFNIKSIDDYYNNLHSKNYHSCHAEFIVKNVNARVSKNYLLSADLLCHYIALLNEEQWFPITYIYIEYGQRLEIIHKLSSKKHFEKVKGLFNVSTSDELKAKLNKSIKTPREIYQISYRGVGRGIPSIATQINVDSLASQR